MGTPEASPSTPLTSVEQIAAAAGNPKKLNGLVSFHDGPNCYNATLLGLGFVRRVAYSDGMEMRYFLESFCLPRSGEAQAGDVLAVNMNDSLAHVALYLGNEMIFEKYSIAGRFGQFRNQAYNDSLLAIRRLTDSDYFMGRREELACYQGKCPSRLVYVCDSAIKVNAELLSAQALKESKLIDAINDRLQAMVLDPKPLEFDNQTLVDVRALSKGISHLPGDRPEHLYVLVKANSIVGYLSNLGSEQLLEPVWTEARDQLRFELRKLQSRLEKTDVSVKTKRILAEPSWLGY